MLSNHSGSAASNSCRIDLALFPCFGGLPEGILTAPCQNHCPLPYSRRRWSLRFAFHDFSNFTGAWRLPLQISISKKSAGFLLERKNIGYSVSGAPQNFIPPFSPGRRAVVPLPGANFYTVPPWPALSGRLWRLRKEFGSTTRPPNTICRALLDRFSRRPRLTEGQRPRFAVGWQSLLRGGRSFSAGPARPARWPRPGDIA